MAESKMIPCPACGKPNPEGTRNCRFCSGHFTERLSLRWMTLGITALFLVAAIHFYQAVTFKPEYVSFAQMTPDMNFEKIRALGRVSDIVIVDEDYGRHVIKIELTAENHEKIAAKLRRITAKLEGEAAEDYLKWGNPPKPGDLIEVAASLYAGEGYRHLSVGAVPFIRILERGTNAPALPPETEKAPEIDAGIQQLLADPESFRDRSVSLASVTVVYAEAGKPFFRVAEAGVTNQTMVVLGYKGPPLQVGQRVSVRGRFIWYAKKGYWEIEVPRGDSKAVTVLPAETGSK